MSTARTGSNHLISLINTNIPGCYSFGELFNLTSLSKSELHTCLSDPITYLNEKIESNSRECVAVGFKMFYYHATKMGFGNNAPFLLPYSPQIRSITEGVLTEVVTDYILEEVEKKFIRLWKYLKDSNYHVIHFKRDNLLRSYISLKYAYITNKWTGITSYVGNKIELSYDECIDYFQKTTDYERKYEKYFKENPTLSITYEQLVQDQGLVLLQLADFLHCKEPLVNNSHREKNELPLSDIVANYSELKMKLKNTIWHQFFNEGQII